MGEHYFSNNPKVESNPQTFESTLKGEHFSFVTDTGVFSKAGVDFGTRLLIETFQEPAIDGTILDVGCGYGPIGITLAKVYEHRRVEMVDINNRALALAKENSDRNNVANVVIYESNIFDKVQKNNYAAIISNPPIRAGKKVVHKILEDSLRHLAIGGELWIVIQKKQGAPSALEKLKCVYEEVEVVAKKKGYYIIRTKKV